MKRWFVFCVATLVLCVCVAGIAPAQDEDDELLVPEIKVIYTRSETDPRKIPASVTVIDAETIEKSGAKTVPDVLRREAGINITSLMGNNTFVDVSTRGSSRGTDTLLMVNGVRLTEPTLAAGDWSLIPLEAVERIEIVRGTGTAYWGDNATAGVVNIITKKGYDVPFATVGTLFGSYGRFEETASAGYSHDLFHAFASGSYSAVEGWRRNSDAEELSFVGSVGFTPTDIFSLSVDAGYVSDSFGLPGDLTAADEETYGRDYSSTDHDRGAGERFYITTGVDFDFDRFGMFTADYSYRDGYWWWDSFDVNGGFDNKSRNKSVEHNVSGKYVWDVALGPVENRVTVGGEYRVYDWSYGLYWPSMTTWVDDDLDRTTRSFYTTDELTLYDMVVLSLGYRYEHAQNHFTMDNLNTGLVTESDEFYTNQAYTAGITFLYGKEGTPFFEDGSKLYFRFSRGYRLPLMDEYFGVGLPSINEDLEPEIVVSYEVGFEHYFTEYLRLTFDYYRTYYEDEIVYDGNMNVNLDKTVHEGIEVGLYAEPLDWLSLYAAYAWQRTVIYSDGYYAIYDTIWPAPPSYEGYEYSSLPMIPEHTVSFGLGIDWKGIAFNTDARWVDERIYDSDFTRQTETLDDYLVVDARLGYTHDFDFMRLEVFFGVNNIFDEEYADYGVYTYEYFDWGTFSVIPASTSTYRLPGREFYGGVTVRF
ncbi:MAG: TonB-dependent receptor [Deltaproteobacteria bacterium]|nr:TonB-dependent receptor [Candidatus Zymogenaceae bacterium]